LLREAAAGEGFKKNTPHHDDHSKIALMSHLYITFTRTGGVHSTSYPSILTFSYIYMQVTLREKFQDQTDGQDELEKELHATEGALLQCNEDLFAAQQENKTLKARITELSRELSSLQPGLGGVYNTEFAHISEGNEGAVSGGRIRQLEDELRREKLEHRIIAEELNLAKELLHKFTVPVCMYVFVFFS
jgi:hypothetical protein